MKLIPSALNRAARIAGKVLNYVHVSAKLIEVMNPLTKAIETKVAKGETYNVGRNAQKRAKRQEQKELRNKWRRLRDYGDPSMAAARFPKIKNLPAMNLKPRS